MTQRTKRIGIVIVALAILSGGMFATHRWRSTGSKENAIADSALRFLQAGDYDSAGVEADKWLRLEPRQGKAHWVKAQALLRGKSLDQVNLTDPDVVSAVRTLIQAARLDPDLTDARIPLLTYFLSAGDLSEAARQAQAIIKKLPDHLDSRYVLACSFLDQRKLGEAAPNLEYLKNAEHPIRPRTAWLFAQASDMGPAGNPYRSLVQSSIRAWNDQPIHVVDPRDRLALVDLAHWSAEHAPNASAMTSELGLACSRLEAMVSAPTMGGAPPRILLQAAGRLYPDRSTLAPEKANAYAAIAPKVEAFVERIFKQAIASEVLDPSVYISFAARQRSQGRVEDAVATVRRGIELARKFSPEARRGFLVCDLWLAEHHAGRRESALARPSIETLLADEQFRPYGQLLVGQERLLADDVDSAAAALAEAVAKLPKHGTAHALLGLCQLRRGLVSEGKSHLETGIALGASEPQYKAWLAIALADAGYQDRAIAMAQEVLRSPEQAGLGRALLGELRLRAGQYREAASDLKEALERATPENRATIQISQAEALLAEGNVEPIEPLLVELKKGPGAPRAYAIEYRLLQKKGENAAAIAKLKEGLDRFPDHGPLLAMEVARLAESKDYASARAIIETARRRQPEQLSLVLLLVEVLELSGQTDQAVKLLLEQQEKKKEEPALKIRLIEALLASRHLTDAGKLLALVKGDPRINPATVDYLSARLASLEGDFRRAEEIINKAAERDPDNPTLKFLLGQMAAAKGNYTLATELLEQSLASGQHGAATVRALFDALVKLGSLRRAGEVLAQAERRGQSVRELRGRLLRALAQNEQWDAMEREIAALLGNAPGEADFALVVSLLRQSRRGDRAEKVLDSAIAKFPKSIVLREIKGAMLLEDRRWDDAKAFLDQLRKDAPARGGVYLLQTQWGLDQGANDLALQSARDGWKNCPGDASVEAAVVQVLVRQNKSEEAIHFADEARRAHPSLPPPHYIVARMEESVGRLPDALKNMAIALEKEPNNSAVANHFVRMRLASNQMEGLEGTIESLLEGNPRNATLVGILAELYANRNEVTKTQELLVKVEERFKGGPLGPYLRAVLALAKRDHVQAEQQLTAAAADPLGHIPSTLLLARLREEQHRPKEAFELVSQVLRQRPTLLMAQIRAVRLLQQMRRLAEAETAAREYLKINANARSLRLLLSQVALARGGEARKAEAREIAQRLLGEKSLSPAEFESAFAVLIAAQGDREAAALIEAKKGQEMEPALLLAAGRAYFTHQRPAASRRLADRVLSVEPNNAAAKLLLADSLVRINETQADSPDVERALEIYRGLLAEPSPPIAAANNLAWTIGVRMKKPLRGLEELLRAVPNARAPHPDLPVELIDTVGTLHLATGHLAEAQRFFEAAAQRAPDHPAFHFHLGQLYKKQGREAQAKQAFAKAAELDVNGEYSKQIKDPSRLGN